MRYYKRNEEIRMKQILQIQSKNNEYIFNGETLEIFLKEDQNDFKEYLNNIENTKVIYKVDNSSDTLSKLTLNVSNSCNLKCKYCYASFGTYGRSSHLMSIETIDKIIDEIKCKGFTKIKTIAFFGGEPLINFNTIKYGIEKFNTNFKEVSNYEITTNSVFLTNEIINFFQKNKVKLVLSIDGPEDITDYLRGKGVFESVMRSIKCAQSLNYSDLEASATYTKKHMDMGYSYNDIKNFFDNLGVKSSISKVSIDESSDLYVTDVISKEEFRKLCKNELENIYFSRKCILNPYMYRVLCSLVFNMKAYQFCDDLQTDFSLSYDYNGDLYNCFRLWGKKEYKLSTDTARNEAVSIKLEEINNKENNEICKDCWAIHMCKECAVEMLLGEIDFPVKNGKCSSKAMYEICFQEIIEAIEEDKIKVIAENFREYLRYE